ncbi:hypothetical protein NQ318_004231 [Aromia moschata]|uniref:phospholipase A2 n=1 Tax=Aromia moschata TaxID=1265417 RepID=A0AAV8Y5U2_9CUCU|nr:hypothetical protein NQ318_004231 [Aromia moschata]
MLEYGCINQLLEILISRSQSGIKFRQLTDGKHLIQLIYDDDNQLRDCEFGHQKDQVKSFLSSFKRDLSNLIATSNITVESLDGKTLPEDLHWMNYTKLREECRQKHWTMKKVARDVASRENKLERDRYACPNDFNASKRRCTQAVSSTSDYPTSDDIDFDDFSFARSSRRERSLLIVPGTLWCGHSHDAATYTQLGRLCGIDRCCRRHDHCKRGIPGFTMRYNLYNYRPFTISHCHCDRRHKRDISELFRIPGTKWCGKGYSAEKYTRLGGFSKTDRCCRRHDLSCPFWIGGFETKYGLFNWRVNTLMHCNCDERINMCKKASESND